MSVRLTDSCEKAITTYLSDEPEGLEGPERWERVEKERVRVRNPVALEVAHFC